MRFYRETQATILDSLYTAYAVNPKGTNFNLCFYVKFPKDDQSEILDKVIHTLQQIPALNKCYLLRGEKVEAQICNEAIQYETIQSDVTLLPTIVKRLAHEPHDLEHKKPVKLTIVELINENQVMLFFNIHHIAMDGSGLELLIDVLNGATEFPNPVETDEINSYSDKEANLESLITSHAAQVAEIYADYEKKLITNSSELYLQESLLPHSTYNLLNTLAKSIQLSPFNLLLLIYALFDCKINNKLATLISYPVDVGPKHPNFSNTVKLQILPFSYNASQNLYSLTEEFKQQLAKLKTVNNYAIEDPQYQAAYDGISSFAYSQMAKLKDVRGFKIQTLPQLGMAPYGIKYRQLGETIYLYFEAYKDVFPEVLTKSILDRFIAFCNKVLSQPELELAKFDLLINADERNHLIYDLNANQVAIPENQTLNTILMESVNKYPEYTAFIFQNQNITYSQLATKVAQCALYLRSSGVKLGDSVALFCDKSLEFGYALLAILQVGANFVPISEEFADERVEFIINDAKVKYALTQTRLIQRLDKFALTLVTLDDLESKLADFLATSFVPTGLTSKDTACILYTSGTTGNPKGVILSHDNIVNYLYAYCQSVNLTAEQVVLQQTSYTFDPFLEEFFTAIYSGATLVFVNKADVLNISNLVTVCNKFNVTHISLTPALLDIINSTIYDQLSTVRTITVGGEELKSEHFTNVIDKINLVNAYGPTEASISITHHHVTYADLNRKIPIGRPLANYAVYMLDQHFNLCPYGIPGEICVAGRGVAQGYLNRADLSAEKFIVNPFLANEPEYSTIYRTGDQGSWAQDGTINYLGRNDFQVKIKGIRIELGEIETRLSQIEGINGSLVLALDDDHGGKFLCAYYTSTSELDNQFIRAELEKHLARYIIPDYFVWLPQFPLTVNGKIDRRSLPKPDLSRLATEYVAPTTTVEKLICEGFASILNLPLVGINDDFFLLGGNSVKAIRLVSLLQQDLNITVADLFKLKTPANLARLEPAAAPELLIKAELRQFYPVSYAQERIFVTAQFSTASALYNVPLRLKLSGKLNFERFESALIELIQRHVVLRSSFKLIDNMVVQIPQNQVDFKLDFVLASLKNIDAIEKEFIQPFDLNYAPLFRAKLIHIAEDLHYLLWDAHHIIFDGGSVDPLARDLLNLYEGNESTELNYDYLDYTIWQREGSGQDKFNQDKRYWLDKFANFTVQELNLPYDFSRPRTTDFHGIHLAKLIESHELQFLQDYSLANGVSLSSLCLAAFKILLYLYSGQEQIVIGIPTDGRTRYDFANLLGMFVNTLPNKSNISSDQTVTEFIQNLHQETIELLSHQEYQMEDLIKSLGLSAEAGRNPLFDVLYNYLEKDNVLQGKEDFTLQVGNAASLELAKFDITLTCQEINQGLNLDFCYRSDLFKSETIDRLATHYINTLRQLVASDEGSRNISDIEFLSFQDKTTLLERFNNTAVHFTNNLPVPRLFEYIAASYPDNIAVVSLESSLTYAQLNSLTNQFAVQFKQEYQISEDQIVALCLNRDHQIMVGILAVLKAGGAYVPIDPEAPQERIRYIVSDTKAKLVLCNLNNKSLLSELLADSGVTVLAIDEPTVLDTIRNNPSDNLLNHINLNSLAYVIYTSGSTGNPKGVMIEHGGLSNYCLSITQKFEVNTGCNGVFVSDYIFDLGNTTLFPLIINGGTIHFIRKKQAIDHNFMASYIRGQQINWIKCTPLYFESVILNYDYEAETPFTKVILGGESCSGALKKYFDHQKSVRLYNHYGPTETTIGCFSNVNYKLTSNNVIGAPLANTKAFVLDKRLNLLPIGAVGELYVTGRGLARCYVNRQDLTDEKFIVNPFQTSKEHAHNLNRVMYATGDLVRWLPDGNLQYIGRNDFQVKIRGYRVELGEIESQLSRYSGVKQVVVLAQSLASQQGSSDKYVVAYYTAEKPYDETELKAYLAKYVPDYMVPSFIIWLESLPFTANGKLDRNALPQPKLDDLLQAYVAPQNLNEEIVCEAVAAILNLDKVGVKDDFFKLGGSSIAAIRLVARLQSHFQVSIADIYTLRSVSEIAKLPTIGKKESITKAENITEFPLLPSQERVFVANQITDTQIMYNVPLSIKITGSVDVDQLGTALDSLIKRHTAFHTGFKLAADGSVVQYIRQNLRYKKDLVHATEMELSSIKQQFVQPFNLLNDILFRIKLVKISSHEHYLLFDVHHIIFDGGSIPIFLDELSRLYDGQDLASISINYHDYVYWNINTSLERLKQQEKNWLDKFQAVDLEPLNLPLDYPRHVTLNVAAKSIFISINKSHLGNLEAVLEKKNISPYVFSLCVINILLYRYTNQNSITIGAAVNGRTHQVTNSLVGMFVNTLPLNNTVTGNMTIDELFSSVSQAVIHLLSNQDYPIESLIESLRLISEGGRNPLFDVIFNYLEEYDEVSSSNGINFNLEKAQAISQAKADLLFILINKDKQFDLEINYRTSLFNEDTINRLGRHFVNIFKFLAKSVVDAVTTVNQVPMLAEYEINQLVSEFNNSQVTYQRNSTILELFDSVVAQYPDSLAVSATNGQLSYIQLQERALSCANQLINAGVKPGDYVAILSSRNYDFYIMVLGILYCEAAFIPLDANYPQERILGILEDSNGYLLTNLERFADYSRRIKLDDSVSAPRHVELTNRDNNTPCCLIYTSGSTGKPKGAVLTQRNIVNFSHWYIRNRGINPGENYAAYASFGFDAGAILSLFPLLLRGLCIHIIPEEIKLELPAIRDFVVQSNSIGCFFTTLLAEQFVEAFETVPGLHYIECGGEKLSKYFKRDYKFYNGYGPTECTVYSHQFEVDKHYANIPIGSVIDNYTCYVVSPDLVLLPIGAVGELLIGGDGVGAGYLNRRELTAEKFIANPFITKEERKLGYNDRLYRTGDLVRMLSDGNVEYIGRNDFQIKIRGYRIELGEIENTFKALPGVDQVLILALEKADKSKYLCAFYTGVNLVESLIRENLERNLANYMIPEYFVWLDKFPLTVNGKVDRNALPKPETSQLTREIIVPSTQEEELVCRAMQEILVIDQVSIDDDFFRLGGNSIKAIKLVSQLQKNFKVNVTEVFAWRTPRKIAHHAEFIQNNLQKRLETIKEVYTASVSDEAITIQVVDLHKQTYLEQVAGLTHTYTVKPIQNVVLTGATGYLGCNVLYQILKNTSYNVYLLIRGKNDNDAFQRVNAKYQFYFDESLNVYIGSRLLVFAADIEDKQLGLTLDLYQFLSSKTDSVIHVAALVKHYGNYEEFYQANVVATVNLLEFTAQTKLKDFHYVSTYSVLNGYIERQSRFFFTEDDDPEMISQRRGDYVITKYLGEREVDNYRKERGVNGNIYRVGNLSMISFNYRNQENIDDNGFYSTFKTLINLGYIAPEIAYEEVSQVDITAAGIIKIFDKQELVNQAFHVYNPNYVHIDALLAVDQELNLKQLNIGEFIDVMADYLNKTSYSEYVERFLLHMGWLNEAKEKSTAINVAQEKTNAILNSMGVTWPQARVQMFSDLIASALKERTRTLAQTQIGNTIGESALFALSKVARLCHYDDGQTILIQGSNDNRYIIVANGFVDNSVLSPSGWSTNIQLFADYDSFGEELVLGQESSSEYSAVFGPVTTIEIAADKFKHLICSYPELTQSVLLKLLKDKNTIQSMFALLK